MIPINPTQLDDFYLHKFKAQEKISKILGFIKAEGNKKLIKTASVDQTSLLSLFTQMLSLLNLKVDGNVKDVLNSLSQNDQIKVSSKKTSERHDDIKIVSKKIKDSHYQFDISKDVVSKDGHKVIMISCYARDAYLGRYLIKRNYFYTRDREEFADRAYDEIMTKIADLKDRYYNEIIEVPEIFAQTKKVLDGVISEIKIEEDTIGNINRQPEL